MRTSAHEAPSEAAVAKVALRVGVFCGIFVLATSLAVLRPPQTLRHHPGDGDGEEEAVKHRLQDGGEVGVAELDRRDGEDAAERGADDPEEDGEENEHIVRSRTGFRPRGRG